MGDQVFLRLVQHRDAVLIYNWESEVELRRFTNNDQPITIELIESLIKEQQNVFDSGQVRFMICEIKTNLPIGMVDLYNADFDLESAEVGIVIIDHENRKKGFARAALKEIQEYASNVLGVYCLRSFVDIDNVASNSLFKSLGYKIEHSISDRIEKAINVFKIDF